MSAEPVTLTWYQNPATWFIAVGTAVTAGIVWLATGQPGAPLTDGSYSCQHVKAASQGMPTLVPPTAKVSGGRVVDVFRDKIANGTAAEIVDWTDLQQRSTDRFRISIITAGGSSAVYECKLYS